MPDLNNITRSQYRGQCSSVPRDVTQSRNLSRDRIQVAHHVVVRHSEDTKALGFEILCSHSIPRNLVVVAHAVDFNDKPITMTEEVDDIGADWMLTPKLQATDLTVS